MASPTDTVPPPAYQISLEEFDQKTSHAVQLSSTTTLPVDEDGWPIYNAAAFEAVAESSAHSLSASSSAGILNTDTSRYERQGNNPSLVKALPSPLSMKV